MTKTWGQVASVCAGIFTKPLHHLEKISKIDWKEASADVERFPNTTEKAGLRLWSERFFTQKLDALMS